MRLLDADKLLNDYEELADCDFIHPLYENTLRDIIDDAPTVEVCDDCINRAEVLKLIDYINFRNFRSYENLIAKINDLPSVTPKAKTGYWIDADDGYPFNAICSSCNRLNHLYGNYCKHCGVKMGVEE